MMVDRLQDLREQQQLVFRRNHAKLVEEIRKYEQVSSSLFLLVFEILIYPPALLGVVYFTAAAAQPGSDIFLSFLHVSTLFTVFTSFSIYLLFKSVSVSFMCCTIAIFLICTCFY